MNFSIKPQYKIRINYKSGNSVEAWFWAFQVHNNPKKITWIYTKTSRPLLLSNDIEEIESVWQIDFRRWRVCTVNTKLFKDFD